MVYFMVSYMGKEQNINKLPRRDFLRDFLKITGIGFLALAGIDQFLGSGAFRQHAEDLFLGAINLNVKGFDNLSSLENCINRGRAFLIVHKGFLANQGYLNNDHPEYLEYWNNIGQLSEYLRLSGEPTFLVIEDRIFQRGDFMADSVSVCTSLVVTINVEGSIKRYVHTHTGIQEQSIPRIIDFLKKSDISTLCFAGEVAHKGIIGSRGCLIEIASYFADEFDIKGVKGCVYPLNPPKAPNAIQRELYFDTIIFPSS